MATGSTQQSAEAVLRFALLAWLAIGCIEGVNLNRYHKLDKQELLALDADVTDFYSSRYEDLDRSNVSYEQHLYRAIRSVRHTIVINHFDFKYASEQLMRDSAGPKVDDQLCANQLAILLEMGRAQMRPEGRQQLPLSAINLLESNSRAESGILNGNFYWMGAIASCVRARIGSREARLALGAHEDLAASKGALSDIQGRYCVAHVRAKSWPKEDIYFEDRITLRVGVCLPDSCHARSYANSISVQRQLDEYARLSLHQPFSGDMYEVSQLYCHPDEDSKFRQWNGGARAFVVFVIAWAALSLYLNFRYESRQRVVRKLRRSVDIKMIIQQRRNSNAALEHSDDSATDYEPSASRVPVPAVQVMQPGCSPPPPDPAVASDELDATLRNLSPLPTGHSRASSAAASELEDNDGDFRPLRPVVVASSNSRRQARATQSSTGFDLAKAFSLESNIGYLLHTRTGENQAKRADDARQHLSSSQPKQSVASQPVAAGRLSQQLNAVARRTSASNEALVKQLQQDEMGAGAARKVISVVKQVKQPTTAGQSPDSPPSSLDLTDEAAAVTRPGRAQARVNIDFLDGIKVYCTGYIVYGHTLMFFFGLVPDLRFADEKMLDITMISSMNALQVVSLFYIITGTLLTYLAFCRNKRRQLLDPRSWLLVICSRYIRLIPSYLLVFWFARHVAPLINSGPHWLDYRTDPEHARSYCSSEPWSTMLTLSAADVKIPFDCVPQAWYLSNDFRTLFIIPIYIIMLTINTTAGYIAILSTFAVSSAKLVYILRSANIDYKVILQWKPHVYAIMADRLHDVYTDLTVRVSTYLLGVVVGHLLYLYETRQIKSWPRWFRRHSLWMALVGAAATFLGAPILSSKHVRQFLPAASEVDSDLVVLLIPLFKIGMEVCLSVILLRLATGGGFAWLTKLLSSRWVKTLSNISYTVFLVHVEVMYKMPMIEFDSDYWYLFMYATFFVLLSTLVGFVLYVVYEMPVNNMTRYVFKKVTQAVGRG